MLAILVEQLELVCSSPQRKLDATHGAVWLPVQALMPVHAASLRQLRSPILLFRHKTTAVADDGGAVAGVTVFPWHSERIPQTLREAAADRHARVGGSSWAEAKGRAGLARAQTRSPLL